MMGERQVAQEALFYEFSLERHVLADHWGRGIDRFVDLSGIRARLRPFYSAASSKGCSRRRAVSGWDPESFTVDGKHAEWSKRRR